MSASKPPYPKALITELTKLNRVLSEQTVYAISGPLDVLAVWPVDQAEPTEAVRSSSTDRDVGLVGLRLADRFVWLSTSELDALINGLRVSRRCVRSQPQGTRPRS